MYKTSATRLQIPTVSFAGIFLVITLSVLLPNIILPIIPNPVYNNSIHPIVKFNRSGKRLGRFIFACILGICVMLSMAKVLIPHMIISPLTSIIGNVFGKGGLFCLLNPYAKIKTIPTTNRIRPRAATGSNFFSVFIKLNASNRGYMDKTTTLREIFFGKILECRLFAMKMAYEVQTPSWPMTTPHHAARRAHVPLAKNAMSMNSRYSRWEYFGDFFTTGEMF